MNIVVLADFLRPNGAGVMALGQAELLADEHDVTLLAASAPTAPTALSTVADRELRFSAFTSVEGVLDKPVTPVIDAELRMAAQSWLLDQIEASDPDVVLVHNVGRVLDQRDVARLSDRRATVMTLHDEWMYTDSHYVIPREDRTEFSFEPYRSNVPSRHGFSHLWDVAALARQLVLICPSKWIQERATSVYPNIPAVHLRNPVDASRFGRLDRAEARSALGLDHDAFLVGFVGDPTASRKNFALLRDAVERTPADEIPCVVVLGAPTSLVGATARSVLLPDSVLDAPTQTRQSPETASLGRILDRCLTIEGLDRGLVPAVYASLDLVVHPSLSDNLPTVPIEAGMSGVRCLASDVGGTAEAVAEADGLFPADETPARLSTRLRHERRRVIAEDPSRRISRRELMAQRFSPIEYRDGLTQILEAMACPATER